MLAVVVQNQEPSSRWYSGSGITRHVHLTVTDPVRVARLGNVRDDAAARDDDPSGYANATSRPSSPTPAVRTQPSRLSYTVRDAPRTRGRRGQLDGSVGPDRRGNGHRRHPRRHPHLWSTTHPYLYTLETRDREHGRTIDSTTTTFGIRWLVFDPNKGIMLNGQHLKLYGVDLHNDEGALGSVDNYDALYRQMSILKSMGVNAFRTSHNPPSPEMIDVCQRLGIVMMVEAFDTWNVRERRQARAGLPPVLRSVERLRHQGDGQRGEELAGGDHVVDRQRDPGVELSDALPIEQRLIADIKSIDTTRPVVAGSDQYRSVPARGRPRTRCSSRSDGLGLNYDTARDDRRAAQDVPEDVLLRVRGLLRDVHSRLLPGPEPAEHRAELHARQARAVLV